MERGPALRTKIRKEFIIDIFLIDLITTFSLLIRILLVQLLACTLEFLKCASTSDQITKLVNDNLVLIRRWILAHHVSNNAQLL